MLSHFAKRLKDAGLKRINMSLDTLNEQKAKFIAQKSVLHEVLAGFEAAHDAGLKVKINTVALKGVNDDELINLLEFAKFRDSQIRFIEYMENSHAKDDLKGLSSDEILKNIVLLARNRSVKYLACEMGYDQKQSLSAFLREQGFRAEFYKDLAQFDRGFVARNLNRS